LSLEIIEGIENFPPADKGVVVTLGTFDGLHLGHQEILRRLQECAAMRNLPAVAVTFEPHPRVLVTPHEPPPLLTSWEEKVALFRRYHQGYLLVLEFNRTLMNLTAEEFVRDYLIEKLKLKKLIVGYDHAFGKNRSGTINDLMILSRQHGFELEVVNPIIREGRPISSTRLRRLLEEQKLGEVLEMLGHEYPIGGKVVSGIGLGKKLGYPTANIAYYSRKLLPHDGVYACTADLGGQLYTGMMFIGTNHFNPENARTVEVNLFDFDRDIYGEMLFCYPRHYIRENRLYTSTAELVAQIENDKQEVLRILHEGEK